MVVRSTLKRRVRRELHTIQISLRYYLSCMENIIDIDHRPEKLSSKTGPRAKTIRERFWARVIKLEDGCWKWGEGKRPGMIRLLPEYGRENISARAASLLIHHKVLPQAGEKVFCTCRNELCINPDHLYIESMDDWARRFGKSNESHIHEYNRKNRERARAAYHRDPEKYKLYQRHRGAMLKIRAVMYLGGACHECGFSKHLAALQFHHVDPAEKRFTIGTRSLSATARYDWDRDIVPELDKCRLLCSNCHFVHHSSMDASLLSLAHAEVASAHPEEAQSWGHTPDWAYYAD